MSTQEYTLRKTGTELTRDFRIYLSLGDKLVSPWHDIPLYFNERDKIFNMIIEVPRWENVKLEIAKDEFLTPLRQDIINDDKLRFVPNIFPHKGYPWNYGSFPKTWEDPTHITPLTSLPGDSDPLDVCELAGEVGYAGQIKQVKVLGAFAVLEEEQTDWKVIVVDTANQALAEQLHDISDVEELMPGYIETMLEWFRVYKVPEQGGKRNEIGLGGKVKGREFAHSLIQDCHKSWKKVLTEPTMETKVSMADVRIEDYNLAQQLPKQPRDAAQRARFDSSMANKCHYLTPNWPLMAKCPDRAMEV